MSYRILDRRDIDNDGNTITLTLHYEIDGISKPCVFVYPATATIYENPEGVLSDLLKKGKEPSGPITYNQQGTSWSG